MPARTAQSPDMSVIENRAPSVGRQLFDRVQAAPEKEAYRHPVGDGWESLTWAETGVRVSRIAAGLVALGVEPEQRVGIASATRLEWILADLAVMSAGAATTTVYPSTNSDDAGFILADSECRVVFAEDDGQLAKVAEHRDDLPLLGKVVTFESSAAARDGSDWVMSLAELESLGAELLAREPDAVERRIDATGPESLATLIYTSGTTGRPKGVRLRHRSWTYEGAAIAAERLLDEDDLQFLWLPMAHSFGKVLLSTQLACGFPTAVDGRVDKIIDNLAVVRPTFMGAAPRIFEKAYSRIQTMQAAQGGVKEKLFNRAFQVGLQAARLEREGEPVPFLLARQRALFDRLVFTKVRDRFGGRVRFFISGSAALNREIAEWFNAAGILIMEGYGLTETSAGSTVNRPHDTRFGSVGLPLPGTEVRAAEDGEILIKGPGVMEGYHNQPEQTAQTLTEDGWLRTGDIGEVDEDGYVRITDRKKDLFKTSGGKYVAPTAIETHFKAICPYASHFLVHGSERNYVVAVITLDPDAIAGWAAENGMGDRTYAELVASDEVHAMMEGYVATLNERLNRWETIKRWILLDHDLSIESGELTPSLKVRRKAVEENYRDQIASLYS
jgi:long-chain acyl-CoA synthetase